jgi:peroxiredoxin
LTHARLPPTIPGGDIRRDKEEMTLEEQGVPEVGQEAPDFTLPATTGGSITLSGYRGDKHVVLAFYALDWTGG